MYLNIFVVDRRYRGILKKGSDDIGSAVCAQRDR